MAARMAMMAITMRSSISVNPRAFRPAPESNRRGPAIFSISMLPLNTIEFLRPREGLDGEGRNGAGDDRPGPQQVGRGSERALRPAQYETAGRITGGDSLTHGRKIDLVYGGRGQSVGEDGHVAHVYVGAVKGIAIGRSFSPGIAAATKQQRIPIGVAGAG